MADGTPAPGTGRRLADELARLRRALRRRTRTTFPLSPLPQAQLEVLSALRDRPAMRVSELASQLQLATNTVSTLVSAMVQAGLLYRNSDPADGRAVWITLAPGARRRLKAWRDHREVVLEEALEGLSPEESAALEAALPALARVAERLERPVVLPAERT